MKIIRNVYPTADFNWGTAKEFCPDLNITATDPNGPPGLTNGSEGKPEEMMALAFTTSGNDVEAHIFLFNKAGKEKLLAALTGGIIVPDPGTILQ